MKTIRAGQSKAVPTMFVVFAFAPLLVGAPGDENWDRNFGVPGVDGRICAMAVSGNELYVGGDFSRINALKDRKSTRLNSSHGSISYAVFCLKKKKKHQYYPFLSKKKKKSQIY